MVFIRDEGDEFEASLDEVWAFIGSGPPHSEAHHHHDVRREPVASNSGVYSWMQEFRGGPVRFTMRWVAFAPVGVAYEVLAGPFEGSKFFLYYTPRGARTRVSVVGEFASKTIPADELEAAVNQFFSVEFDQDSRALRASRSPRRVEPGAGPGDGR
jgi:hypothetical protein